MMNPEGDEITLPPQGHMNDIYSLVNIVLSYITMYDNVTDGEYSKRQRELAEAKDMPFEQYIRKLVEHQMCLRFKSSIPCWSDGAGDDLHSLLSKVDGYVEKIQSSTIKRFIERSIKKITPSGHKKFSSCQTCGGSQVMNPNINNLGRADRLNR